MDILPLIRREHEIALHASIPMEKLGTPTLYTRIDTGRVV